MLHLILKAIWQIAATTLILALICAGLVLLAIVLRRAARYVAAAVDTWWWQHTARQVARNPLEDVDLSDLDGELRRLMDRETGR